MPREITTTWTNQGVAGLTTVMYFNKIHTASAQRTALNTFFTGMNGFLDNGCSWSISTAGRELNDATGVLEGAWSDPTPHVGTGTVTGEANADATQLLYQWRTPAINRGRFVRGRTFIPGVTNGQTVAGNPAGTLITGAAALGVSLCNADVGFGIWSRPVKAIPPDTGHDGLFVLASTCTVWAEYAVLRQRRR